MRIVRFSAVWLAVACFSSFAEAQQAGPAPQPVTIGTRVRILAPSIRRERIAGRVDSLTSGEMVLDTTGVRRRLGFETGPILVESFRIMRLRTGAIEQIEVSGGRTTRRSTIKGALIGGVGGGLLVGVGQAPEVNPTFKDFMKSAPIGFAAGAVIGGVVGYLLGGEKWVPGIRP